MLEKLFRFFFPRAAKIKDDIRKNPHRDHDPACTAEGLVREPARSVQKQWWKTPDAEEDTGFADLKIDRGNYADAINKALKEKK